MLEEGGITDLQGAEYNILVEQEFEIALGGQIHKVKATAAFLVGGFVLTTGGMKEEGSYLLNFTLRG